MVIQCSKQNHVNVALMGVVIFEQAISAFERAGSFNHLVLKLKLRKGKFKEHVKSCEFTSKQGVVTLLSTVVTHVHS